MGFHDATADSQAQAGTAFLGCREWLEDFFERLGGDSRPVIDDDMLNAATEFLQALMQRDRRIEVRRLKWADDSLQFVDGPGNGDVQLQQRSSQPASKR